MDNKVTGTMRHVLTPLLLLLVSLTTAHAGRQIDRTVDASPDGVVSIELLSGELEIRGGSGSKVHVRGELGDDVEELEIEADGDEVSIEVEFGRRRNIRDGHVELEIDVPARSSLEVETISGVIRITNVSGEMEVETVSGSIEIDGARREVEVAAVSGSIRVRADERFDGGEFTTVSGSIRYEGPLRGKADLAFESVSGSVTVIAVGPVSAEFSIETFSGSIRNEFGPRPKVGELIPSQSLEFSEGSGDADVSIEVFSGKVSLRRK